MQLTPTVNRFVSFKGDDVSDLTVRTESGNVHMLHEFFEDLNDFCMTNQELGLVRSSLRRSYSGRSRTRAGDPPYNGSVLENWIR